MNNFEEKLKGYAEITQQAMDAYLNSEDCLQKNVIEAMRYSLLNGGKRIRASLVLEFCNAVGGELSDALPFACAVEMVHAFSLIHDDLPCMDDDDFRRGQPACHIQFDEATALLAGDALFSLAFEVIAAHPNIETIGYRSIVQAQLALAKATGAYGMIGGQMIDLECAGKPVSLDIINSLQSLKTGRMMEVCGILGCIAGGASDETTDCAAKYAQKLGQAFQVIDDILDAIGDEQILGKPVGSDKENNKTTYLSFMDVTAAKRIAQNLISEAKQALTGQIFDNEFLLYIADMVATRNK